MCVLPSISKLSVLYVFDLNTRPLQGQTLAYTYSVPDHSLTLGVTNIRVFYEAILFRLVNNRLRLGETSCIFFDCLDSEDEGRNLLRNVGYCFPIDTGKHLRIVSFLKRFMAQTVYTVCTRINYKIVPLINFNKYLHYGTSGTE
jgi:hypothetical protein